jgi:hypothetical protein
VLYRTSLLFTTTQTHTPLANFGRILIGERNDTIVDLRSTRSLLDLLFRSRTVTVAENNRLQSD